MAGNFRSDRHTSKLFLFYLPLCLLAASTAICPAAFSSEFDRIRAEFGVYSGGIGLDAGKIVYVGSDRTVSNYHSSGSSYLGGMRLGARIYSLLWFETSIGASTEQYLTYLVEQGENTYYEPDTLSIEESDVIFLYRAGLSIDLLKGPVRPFISGNLTWILMQDDSVRGFGYGGGVKFRIHSKISLRLDYQVFKAQYESSIGETVPYYPDPGDPWNMELRTVEWPFNDDFSYGEISLGVSVLLGK